MLDQFVSVGLVLPKLLLLILGQLLHARDQDALVAQVRNLTHTIVVYALLFRLERLANGWLSIRLVMLTSHLVHELLHLIT